MPGGPLVLVDTNVIIEAVRCGVWAAITGGLRVATVQTCADEARAGHPDLVAGYVEVSNEDLARCHEVHAVQDKVRTELTLRYPDTLNLDAGERDLLAHAIGQVDPDERSLCSPDKAFMRAAVALDLGEELTSLESLSRQVGRRPNPRFARQFTEQWMRVERTKLLLE